MELNVAVEDASIILHTCSAAARWYTFMLIICLHLISYEPLGSAQVIVLWAFPKSARFPKVWKSESCVLHALDLAIGVL